MAFTLPADPSLRWPYTLFDVTAAGSAALLKTLWPGAYDPVALPSPWCGKAAALRESEAAVGAVFSPSPSLWTYGVNLDFAAVGAAGQNLVLELGRLGWDGAMPHVMADVTLAAMTNGTIADVNPFTGAATAGVTWRLFDTAAVTARDRKDRVEANVNGATADMPVQLRWETTESPYYYVLVRNLNALTRALCVITPAASRPQAP